MKLMASGRERAIPRCGGNKVEESVTTRARAAPLVWRDVRRLANGIRDGSPVA